MHNSQTRTGIIFGLLAASIWGGMYVVSKVVLEYVPPFTLLTLRLVLGVASLALWMRLRNTSWPQLGWSVWFDIVRLGALGYGISLGMQFMGTQLSTAANGAVITAITPALIFVFAPLLIKEKAGTQEMLVMIVSIFGVLLVIDPRQAQLGGSMWGGNLLLLGAAVTWARYSVEVRALSSKVHTFPLTLVALAAGLLFSVPISMSELRVQQIPSLSPALWAGILYLGVISTAVAAYLWNQAFALLPARKAALTFFAQPLVGAGLGIALLGEPFTLQFAVGAGLILWCLWLAASGDKIQAPEAE